MPHTKGGKNTKWCTPFGVFWGNGGHFFSYNIRAIYYKAISVPLQQCLLHEIASCWALSWVKAFLLLVTRMEALLWLEAILTALENWKYLLAHIPGSIPSPVMILLKLASFPTLKFTTAKWMAKRILLPFYDVFYLLASSCSIREALLLC